jgi:hypothetical protein
MAEETIEKEVETTEPKEGRDYIICPLDEIRGILYPCGFYKQNNVSCS